MKVQVDASTNTIWLKPMLTGIGTIVSQDITVNARLPTGETTSFTFHLEVIDPQCMADLVPSVPVD